MLYVSYHATSRSFIHSCCHGQDFLSVTQPSSKCSLNAQVIIQNTFLGALGKIRLIQRFVLTVHKHAPTHTNAHLFIIAIITLNCNLSLYMSVSPTRLCASWASFDYSVSSFISSVPNADSGTWVPSLLNQWVNE